MLAVIRVRGSTGMRPQAVKTAELLRLHKINHLVLLEDNEVYRSMLQKVKDYVTWGEVDQETLQLLLKHRARLRGRKPLPEDHLKEAAGYANFSTLAKALIGGKVKYTEIKDIVPVIRLHPPRGGYEYIRKNYQQGGTTGYRGEKINALIRKMILPGVDLNGKNEN
ncbi:50S ribosomal protein L30 [Thermoplasmatales archaeon AK]|nr:50S ribosomal protein L30 [Thermoplasmatales archaeon AK]